MPGDRLTKTQKHALEVFLEDKTMDPHEIANLIPCSYDTVMRYRRVWEAFGTIAPPQHIPMGRRPKITEVMAEGLVDYLKEKPSAYLDEMVVFLWDEFNELVHETTIRRCLKKRKISRKKLQRRAQERSQLLRDEWLQRLAGWRAEQLFFVNESAANERNAHRKYGWSPLGTTPHEYGSFKRSERWSLLPCYTINGYIAWEVIHGSYTTTTFNNFIYTRVLPLAIPGFTVLVMDNAPIHHSAELLAMCEEAGVELVYLPPYSPDYNPIEESFAELKAWFRKNKDLVTAHENFGEFIKLGLAVLADKTGNHFRSCYIDTEV